MQPTPCVFDAGKTVTSFAVGSKRLVDFVDDNPQCVFLDVGYVNDINVIQVRCVPLLAFPTNTNTNQPPSGEVDCRLDVRTRVLLKKNAGLVVRLSSNLR